MRNDAIPEAFHAHLSPELSALLRRMASRDPDKRPTAAEVAALPSVRHAQSARTLRARIAGFGRFLFGIITMLLHGLLVLLGVVQLEDDDATARAAALWQQGKARTDLYRLSATPSHRVEPPLDDMPDLSNPDMSRVLSPTDLLDEDIRPLAFDDDDDDDNSSTAHHGGSPRVGPHNSTPARQGWRSPQPLLLGEGRPASNASGAGPGLGDARSPALSPVALPSARRWSRDSDASLSSPAISPEPRASAALLGSSLRQRLSSARRGQGQGDADGGLASSPRAISSRAASEFTSPIPQSLLSGAGSPSSGPKNLMSQFDDVA
ncbi:MAG: hypothetical protein CML43_20190 [Rhodobacteraceae bacterium]|nr:hypothetical protein [Paracoccaceae bacterium]